MVALCPSRHVVYAVAPKDTLGARLLLRETSPAEAPRPRLLDRVRQAIVARHYSRRTEKARVHWIKRYIFFHGKRHPAEMGHRRYCGLHGSKRLQPARPCGSRG